MKRLKSVFGILAIAMVTPLLATNAKGQSSEIYSDFVSFNLGANSQMTGSISVPQFNPALGVLDSVQLNIDTSYYSAITLSGPDGASGQVEAVGSVILQDSGNNIFLSMGADLYGAWYQNFSLPYVQNLSGADESGYLSTPYTYDSPAVLNEFTGENNFSLQVTGSQSISASGGAGLNINEANLNADLSVTYDYTVVPEPGSFSLLAVGFGIMLTWRKARRFASEVV